MNSTLLKNIGRFVILVFVQVMMFNKINLGGYINPFVYILFILLLPFETKGGILLISSFLIGLSVDVFSGTIGVHAAAATFMAFMRPLVIRSISSKKDYEPGMAPGIWTIGFSWFFTYTLILTIIHHTAFFFLDVFSMREAGQTFLRVILSSSVTIAMIIALNSIFSKKPSK